MMCVYENNNEEIKNEKLERQKTVERVPAPLDSVGRYLVGVSMGQAAGGEADKGAG